MSLDDSVVKRSPSVCYPSLIGNYYLVFIFIDVLETKITNRHCLLLGIEAAVYE